MDASKYRRTRPHVAPWFEVPIQNSLDLLMGCAKDFGTKRRAFRADRAVFFTYRDYINDVRRSLGLKVDLDK